MELTPPSDRQAPFGLTESEIFSLYCRLLALEQRLGEIDALASAIRPPFAEPADLGVSPQASG
jgi:hypothetical protein